MQMMSACGPSRTSSNVRFCAAVVDERTYRYCAEPEFHTYDALCFSAVRSTTN